MSDDAHARRALRAARTKRERAEQLQEEATAATVDAIRIAIEADVPVIAMAEELGMHRQSLYEFLRRHQIVR